MNFKRAAILGMVLLAGGIFVLLIPALPTAHAEMKDVKVLERKPDESNPDYEIIKVEGGLIFRAPKDMTFVKQDGVIAPISTEEYCLRKFGVVAQQIKALSKRISVLEANAGTAPDKQNQASL
ncbi:MAG: hypothetical protein ABH891_06600 [Candidatus Omnitrophota bacterium]